MRKIVSGVVAFGILGGLAGAQEPLPPEHAQQVARQCIEAAKSAGDTSPATELDPERAVGIRAGDRGLLVIPAKGLAPESLGKDETGNVPVGQLWLRDLAPVIDGRTVGRDQVRRVSVTIKDQTHELGLFPLAARRRDGDNWELLVYGKGREPLARLPMKAVDAAAEGTPIRVDGKRNDNDTGDLTFTILARYQAVLVLAEAAE